MKRARTVFVGRDKETEELLAGLEDVAEGNGRLFVIDGEPGIGKTRLGEELTVHARKRGVLPLWSRCWKESQAPAYWPWVQLVRACLRAAEGSEIVSLAESAISDIAQVLPEACESGFEVRGRRDEASGDPEQARFRLFDAVLALFRLASSARPLMLVMDDLGAADRASLLLLRFFARELHGCRILLVVTYRDAEVRGSPALAEAIGDLAREGTHIKLRGLDAAQVGRLIEAQTGEHPGSETLEEVCRATGGNPFLVQSLAQNVPLEALAAIEGGWPGVSRPMLASGLGAAIRAHLAPLSEHTRKLLIVAAVAGREFEAELLQRATNLSAKDLFEKLSEAEGYSLLAELPDAPGRYRFVHTLVRDALYDSVMGIERANLHNRIGEALQAMYGDSSQAPFGELAHHFFEGARTGSCSRALDYAERAADRANAQSAFEEAARCYQMALAAMKMSGRVDERRRCELLLAMGEAQNRSADYAGARDTFVRAAELATRLGNRDMLAHAALGYPGLQWGASTEANEESIRLLEGALRAFTDGDDPWRAMLMARLASELYYRPADAGRREKLATKAVEMARKVGDKRALLAILGHRDLTLSGPDTLDARLCNAQEMLQVADDIGSDIGRYMALLSRAIYYRHAGDLQRAEAEAEAMALVASMTGLPVCNWGVQCFAAYRALMQGRYAEGEEIGRECLNFAERIRGGDSDDLFWPAMIDVMREQGRLEEIEPMAAHTVHRRPTLPAFRALHALINCGLGRMQLARMDFDLLAARNFADLPRDNTFLACAASLAQVCAELGDRRRAGQLLKMLSGYEELIAVFGPLGSFGSMARYLGMLAATAALPEQAEAYFQKAIECNAQVNARPCLAYTLVDYAAMLISGGSHWDLARASESLASAREIAGTVGMSVLRGRIDGLAREAERAVATDTAGEVAALSVVNGQSNSAEAGRVSSSRPRVLELVSDHRGQRRAGPAPSSRNSEPTPAAVDREPLGSPASHAVFRRDGDYWTISYEGRVFRLKHVKGLDCLAYLLAHPSTEVHSSNLAAVMNRLASAGAETHRSDGATEHTANDLGDAGPILDGAAKAAYRQRFVDLREELEEAKQMNDFDRASRLEEEVDFLTTELSRAVGLGGRDRRASSSTERARLNVTKAIKSVLGKIAQNNRNLGSHLTATVRTGTFCSYMPDPRSPIFWEIG